MNIRVKFDVLTNVIFFLADLTQKNVFFLSPKVMFKCSQCSISAVVWSKNDNCVAVKYFLF